MSCSAGQRRSSYAIRSLWSDGRGTTLWLLGLHRREPGRSVETPHSRARRKGTFAQAVKPLRARDARPLSQALSWRDPASYPLLPTAIRSRCRQHQRHKSTLCHHQIGWIVSSWSANRELERKAIQEITPAQSPTVYRLRASDAPPVERSADRVDPGLCPECRRYTRSTPRTAKQAEAAKRTEQPVEV